MVVLRRYRILTNHYVTDIYRLFGLWQLNCCILACDVHQLLRVFDQRKAFLSVSHTLKDTWIMIVDVGYKPCSVLDTYDNYFSCKIFFTTSKK